MVMFTFPLDTSRDRAPRMIVTSARTISVNSRIPSPNVAISVASYSFTPEKDMKAIAIRPAVMKVMPRP